MNTITTNRRQMLLGLAAASTAAATTVDASTSEHPELISLGNGLAEVENCYITARDEKKSIYRMAMKDWPLAPEEVIRSRSPRASLSGAIERDVAGAGLVRKGESNCFGLLTVSEIQSTIICRERDIARILKTKRQTRIGWHVEELAEAKRKLPKAKTYWTKCERISKTSGYDLATKAEASARDALIDHVDSIMAIGPLTMEGVLIQAQALIAWQNVDRFYRGLTVKAADWPQKLAASVLAQSSGQSV